MFFSATAALALASCVSAFPTLVQRENGGSPLNITYYSPVNSSLPNILIFATGGTIAGSSASNTDATQYQAGVIGIEALVVAVPELLNISNIDGVQVSNVGSGDVSSDLVLHMSKLANYALCSENSKYSGLVITHGTDTLEETAFAMDITVNCGAPVVVVGAMRPSTAISADGPANLLSAVAVAASPEARDRGTMIVLNDRIGQAWYTIKRNANVLDTFGATEQGYLGGLLSFKPFFYYPASQPTFKRTFDVSYVETMPQVDIIYCSQDYDFEFINDAVENGAKGIILAGTGAGDIASGSEPYVANATAAGVHVVVSTKINVGAVVPSGGGDTISAGFLNPVKSRIQLQHAIANGLSKAAIRDVFEGYLANYIGN